MNKTDKFIKHYFGNVKTASPKYYKKLVEEINSITDQEDKWISVLKECADKIEKDTYTESREEDAFVEHIVNEIRKFVPKK